MATDESRLPVPSSRELRQFKQRVAVRLKIERLSEMEVGEYIRHRWTRAGGGEPPFSQSAVLEIARSSKGIPRLINAICDNALTTIAAERLMSVGPEHIREVCADLDIVPAPAMAAAAPGANASAPAGVFAGKARPDESPDAGLPLRSLQRYAPSKSKTFLARLAAKFSA